MQYLSTEQALADFSYLIQGYKEERGAQSSKVVAFGGSYGGMLSAWWRLKYPWIVDGAVAASAPIWSFEGEVPASDPGSFAKIVTQGEPSAGATSKPRPEPGPSSSEPTLNPSKPKP